MRINCVILVVRKYKNLGCHTTPGQIRDFLSDVNIAANFYYLNF